MKSTLAYSLSFALVGAIATTNLLARDEETNHRRNEAQKASEADTNLVQRKFSAISKNVEENVTGLKQALSRAPRAFASAEERAEFQQTVAASLQDLNAVLEREAVKSSPDEETRKNIGAGLLASAEVLSKFQPVLDQIAYLEGWNSWFANAELTVAAAGVTGFLVFRSKDGQAFFNRGRKTFLVVTLLGEGALLYIDKFQIESKLTELRKTLGEQVQEAKDVLVVMKKLDDYLVSIGASSVAGQMPNLKKAMDLVSSASESKAALPQDSGIPSPK